MLFLLHYALFVSIMAFVLIFFCLFLCQPFVIMPFAMRFISLWFCFFNHLYAASLYIIFLMAYFFLIRYFY